MFVCWLLARSVVCSFVCVLVWFDVPLLVLLPLMLTSLSFVCLCVSLFARLSVGWFDGRFFVSLVVCVYVFVCLTLFSILGQPRLRHLLAQPSGGFSKPSSSRLLAQPPRVPKSRKPEEPADFHVIDRLLVSARCRSSQRMHGVSVLAQDSEEINLDVGHGTVDHQT